MLELIARLASRGTMLLAAIVVALALAFVYEQSLFGALRYVTAFAFYRISELAELPLWIIHIAWPLTGVAWIVFLGEKFVDNIRVLTGRKA